MPTPFNFEIMLSEYPVKGDVQSIDISNLTGNNNFTKTSGHFSGFSFRETTEAQPARIDIYDGFDANGDLIATINLAPGESTRDWYGFIGIYFQTGLFGVVVSGSIAGAVWVRF